MQPALKAWRDNEYIKIKVWIHICSTKRPDGMPKKKIRGINKIFPIGETYEISVTPLAGFALADDEPKDEEVLGTGVRNDSSKRFLPPSPLKQCSSFQ